MEVERKIKQTTMRESILNRSMWKGSTKATKQDMFIYDEATDKFIKRNINFIPALYKCLDEVIVNALDHYTTYPNKVDVIKVSIDDNGKISVYNSGPGISIEEVKTVNGESMYTPQMAFTEFLAGSNLDDNNDKGRIVGGQNGLGAKIVCVYSKEMYIETVDDKRKLYYNQTFKNTRLEILPPNIYNYKTNKWVLNKDIKFLDLKPHTMVSYLLKYDEFKVDIEKYLPELTKILEMRTMQAAIFATKADVYFNGKLIPKLTFEEFCYKFNSNIIHTKMTSEKQDKYNWELCLGISDGKEDNISLINGIYVSQGGEHIKHIQSELVNNLKPYIEKEIKKSKAKFNKNIILNNIFIFIKGYIPDPSFSGQVKEYLQGSNLENYDLYDYKFPNSHWKKIWDFSSETILSYFLEKQIGPTKTRTTRQKIDLDKYEEAYYCRDVNKCHKCFLILTEGDSASGTATTGLTSKNADPTFNFEWYGLFSLGGVIINGLKESIEIGAKKSKTKISKPKKTTKKLKVEIEKNKNDNEDNDAKNDNEDNNKNDNEDNIYNDNDSDEIKSMKSEEIKKLFEELVNIKRSPNAKLLKNERIMDLIKVLGLDFKKKYETDEEYKTLRYGGIIGLTDQDLDGFNIFGLVATLFLTYWPALVNRGFIRRIQTPVIRAYPNNKKDTVKEFYSETQYKDWIETIEPGSLDKYKIKYYKGLGSHIKAFGEVNQMFKDINNKICTFILDENAIKEMYIYYGENTSLRKTALRLYSTEDPKVSIEQNLSIQFNHYTKKFQQDNIFRKLMDVIDGFVSSRRKVYYAATKLGNKEIKVAGLASDTVKYAEYHHGEASLEQTIVRMAQAYPKARNLPLLLPLGEFGTLDRGYKNWAAPRYIYTKLNSRLANKLFRKEDEFILEYEVEDGNYLEPKRYAPIIPYVLCENNDLPGTGWRITIHARNLDDIINNTKKMILGKIDNCEYLRPNLNHFKGEIRKVGNNEYYVGSYTYNPKKSIIHITELPPSTYSKAYLKGEKDGAKSKKEKKEGFAYNEWVKESKDNTSIDNGISIEIQLKDGAYEHIKEKYGDENFDCFIDFFKLKEVIKNRINLIGQNNEVIEYKTYEDVFDDWFLYRKKLYKIRVERETILVELLLLMLLNMQRYSKEHDKYHITNKTTEEEAINIIRKNKYNMFNHILLESPKYTSINILRELITEEKHGASYDYLLNMRDRDKTEEAYKKRQEKIDELKNRLELLNDGNEKFKGSNIWLSELEELSDSIKKGIASDWFYGENKYTFEDSDLTTKRKKSRKQ